MTGRTWREPKRGAPRKKFEALCRLVYQECDDLSIEVNEYVTAVARYRLAAFRPSSLVPSPLNRVLAKGFTGQPIVAPNSAEAQRRRLLAYRRLREKPVDRGTVLLMNELRRCYDMVRQRMGRPDDEDASRNTLDDQYALRGAANYCAKAGIRPALWVRAVFELVPKMSLRRLWDLPEHAGTPLRPLRDQVYHLLEVERRRANLLREVQEDRDIVLGILWSEHQRLLNHVAGASIDGESIGIDAALFDLAEDLSFWSWAYWPYMKPMIYALRNAGGDCLALVEEVDRYGARLAALGITYGTDGSPR